MRENGRSIANVHRQCDGEIVWEQTPFSEVLYNSSKKKRVQSVKLFAHPVNGTDSAFSRFYLQSWMPLLLLCTPWHAVYFAPILAVVILFASKFELDCSIVELKSNQIPILEMRIFQFASCHTFILGFHFTFSGNKTVRVVDFTGWSFTYHPSVETQLQPLQKFLQDHPVISPRISRLHLHLCSFQVSLSN